MSAVLSTFSKPNCSLVTLFGLSAEELLEGGALYEEVKAIEGMLDA